MSSAVRTRLGLASMALLAVLMSGGCAGTPVHVSGVKLDFNEQREHLKGLCRNITGLVIMTCRKVERQCIDEQFEGERRVRRQCAMWQTTIIEECREALELEDPRRSMIDLWTLALQYQAIVAEGKVAPKLFGKAEPHVVAGVERIVQTTEEAAHEFFEPKDFEAAKRGIHEFLANRPPPDVFTRDYYRPAFSSAKGGVNLFGGILGTSQAAEAVDRIAIETDQAAWLAGWLPLMFRLQGHVLLMDLAEVPFVVEVFQKLDAAQKAIVGLEEASQRLPKDLETTFVNVFNKIRTEQGELRDTLGTADKTVANAREAIASSKQVAEQVDATVQKGQVLVTAIERAIKALEPTVAAVTKLADELVPDASKPRPEGRKGLAEQLATIERTATKLAATTDSANQAVAGLRALLVNEGGLAAVDRATEATLDRAFWRAVLLVVVVLAAAVIYRVIHVRVVR